MKSLNKGDIKVLSEHVDKLHKAWRDLHNAVDEFNGQLSEAWSGVEEAQSAFNEVVSDAAAFRDEIVSRMDDYIGERSEKWSESEAAQNYQAWKDEWEGLDFAECQLGEPDGVEIDIDNAAEGLEQLPVEVDQ